MPAGSSRNVADVADHDVRVISLGHTGPIRSVAVTPDGARGQREDAMARLALRRDPTARHIDFHGELFDVAALLRMRTRALRT